MAVSRGDVHVLAMFFLWQYYMGMYKCLRCVKAVFHGDLHVSAVFYGSIAWGFTRVCGALLPYDMGIYMIA